MDAAAAAVPIPRTAIRHVAWAVLGTVILAGSLIGCTSAAEPGRGGALVPVRDPMPAGPGRGFPTNDLWVSYYGPAAKVDLDRMAATFRIINIDADPGTGAMTAGDVTRLKADGRNRVISYFNLGSVERSRDYWSRVPAGMLAPASNRAAQLGPYRGYPDEVWMDPSNTEWRRVLIDYVAPRLVAQGIDGFYFDNMEVVEHDANSGEPVCGAHCRQGGLDLLRELRQEYPNLLFVMQNATSDVTRNGRSGDRSVAELLDGVAHEDTFTSPGEGADARDVTYTVRANADVVAELQAWRGMQMRPGGRPFWIATEDYVNSCDNRADAQTVHAMAARHGFASYISDKSALQGTVCYW